MYPQQTRSPGNRTPNSNVNAVEREDSVLLNEGFEQRRRVEIVVPNKKISKRVLTVLNSNSFIIRVILLGSVFISERTAERSVQSVHLFVEKNTLGSPTFKLSALQVTKVSGFLGIVKLSSYKIQSIDHLIMVDLDASLFYYKIDSLPDVDKRFH